MVRQEEILDELRAASGPMTSKEIAAAIGCSWHNIDDSLWRLRKWGLVEVAGAKVEPIGGGRLRPVLLFKAVEVGADERLPCNIRGGQGGG